MFKRSERLRELFLQQVSEILRDLKDPGLSGFLTVTGLDLSPDMKNARVFYSILGSQLDRESTARALERSAGHVRRELLAKLDIKFAPRIAFEYDETPERANRIENILSRLDQEKGASAPSAPASEEELKRVAAGRRTRRPGKRRKN